MDDDKSLDSGKVQTEAERAPMNDAFWRVSGYMKNQAKRPRGPLQLPGSDLQTKSMGQKEGIVRYSAQFVLRTTIWPLS